MAILRCINTLFDPESRTCGLNRELVLAAAHKDPQRFCARYPQTLLPHPTNCARYYNCSAPFLSDDPGPAHLQECPYPQLFDANLRRCDNFLHVVNTDGCGTRTQPKHFCDYASTCPSTRFPTCDLCRIVLPSCEKKTNGIHSNPPGRAIAPSFVYCVEGRVMATSPCPPGTLFHESVKSCVPSSSKMSALGQHDGRE
ncbi:uncharacterized protein LOC101846938 [Aplysia californica]|uniref:Uncharacterized protein LOC101846938 n=1 Tax=Aplysia californica TaxID=6500 RepID=A0ABM1AE17_APLCA|nr:uncharacterized protein LOC101846938 [Aplysia californica]